MGLWGQVDNIVEYWRRKQYWSHGYQDAKVLIGDTAISEQREPHVANLPLVSRDPLSHPCQM